MTPHITLDPNGSGALYCHHCVSLHPPTGAIPVERWIDECKGFLLMHKHCEKPLEPKRQVELFDELAKREPAAKCCGQRVRCINCPIPAHVFDQFPGALPGASTSGGIDCTRDEPDLATDPPLPGPCGLCGKTGPRIFYETGLMLVCAAGCDPPNGYADTERERPQAPDACLDDPDPEDDKPEFPDVFGERYPMARDVPTLRQQVELLLPIADASRLAAVALPDPTTAVFSAIAHWARVEAAHNEAPTRAPVAGMYIPMRLPMPQALKDAIGKPVKKKRGARPLSSPKASRGVGA